MAGGHANVEMDRWAGAGVDSRGSRVGGRARASERTRATARVARTIRGVGNDTCLVLGGVLVVGG